MQKRPTGIAILSILALVGGIFVLGQSIRGGNLSIILVISIVFIGILAIGSGIGMLLAKRWGWWLGLFYYVYAILRYLNTIFFSLRIGSELQSWPPEISSHIMKYSIRIIIHSLILLYFFKKDIMEYFNVSHYSKLKSILILFGIGIAIMLIGTLGIYII